MGSSGFAVPVLGRAAERLSSWGVPFFLVTTPSGRGGGGRPVPSAVARWAQGQGLAVEWPAGRRDLAALASRRPSLILVAAYGRILPPSLLAAVPARVNVHPSLLPRWRGPAPVPWTIWSGDREAGVSLLDVGEEVDGGDLFAQAALPVDPRETAGELTQRLAERAADMVAELLDLWRREGRLPPARPQQGEVTYARRLTAQDEPIRWQAPAEEVVRQVLALAPEPGAHARTPAGRLKVLRAEVAWGFGPGLPGEVVQADPRKGLVVAAGEGGVRLLEVRPEGGRTMAGAAYAMGRRGLLGEVWDGGTGGG